MATAKLFLAAACRQTDAKGLPLARKVAAPEAKGTEAKGTEMAG